MRNVIQKRHYIYIYIYIYHQNGGTKNTLATSLPLRTFRFCSHALHLAPLIPGVAELARALRAGGGGGARGVAEPHLLRGMVSLSLGLRQGLATLPQRIMEVDNSSSKGPLSMMVGGCVCLASAEDLFSLVFFFVILEAWRRCQTCKRFVDAEYSFGLYVSH